MTPLEDQQLGGLIMWIPAGLVYVIAGLALLAGWIHQSERRASHGQWLVVHGVNNRSNRSYRSYSTTDH
jgi:cytochrome c oxidase assembly factor CtaG